MQQRVAQEVLTNLKDHPDAWTRVDTILEFSQNMKTKVPDTSFPELQSELMCFIPVLFLIMEAFWAETTFKKIMEANRCRMDAAKKTSSDTEAQCSVSANYKT